MWSLTVSDVVPETADAVTIVFDRPSAVVDAGYRAGQFLTLRIPSEQTGSVARCYSLCSSPATDKHMAVTVKRTATGYASNWLCDNVRPGDELGCLPPAGLFTPADLDANLLLIAGGSGITPMVSIAKTVLARGRGRIVLLYANRDPESVIFAAQLRDLVAEHSYRLTVVQWLENVQGLPSEATIASLLAPYAGYEVFVCGPKPFMKMARRSVEGLGVSRDRIHIENFVSLSGDPFADRPVDVDHTAALAPDATQPIAQLVVSLNGATHTLTWTRKDTLIDLLVEQGIDAPYSCRVGDCGTCQCVLIAGDVDMDTHGALDDEDTADGLVLGCQARPASAHITIEF
ncbi:ferredoxin--NADP reductase [Mycolicibacterium porcinum]|uniref:Ferredoxin--NADP reductase n=1 Tax=Mycolicibacterium porcinum TaxID=39693 RepID=A0AAW5SZX1_9MYCO|nr:ferredoxin--NADP reductase [Mycolicibacterium porcinum]MCV7388142.1 ferredoxin--NADP reductase [Mycolicibacterium porcinum]ORB43752.1 3-ketosteroid-9-alpha-hydroxylase [Mycolicibacterium porcinum]